MAASSQQSMAQSPSPRQRTGFIERPVFRIAPEDVCLPNRPGPHGLRGHALVARRETPGHRIYSLFTMSNTREPPEAVRESQFTLSRHKHHGISHTGHHTNGPL